jgi:hypothetical protein
MSGLDVVTPRFSTERRKDLRELGLIDAQIEGLEDELPRCRLLITDDPPLRSVRERLELVARTISDAQQKICQFADEPAAWEARHRIDAASHALGGDLGETGRACAALDALGRVVERAVSDLGTTQRRTNSAASMPIKLIHEALMRGWAKGAQGPIRQFNIKVSSAPEGVFLKVVAICYETMKGSQDIETPLRPVRSYMDHLRREREELSRRRESVVSQDEKNTLQFSPPQKKRGKKRQGSQKTIPPF